MNCRNCGAPMTLIREQQYFRCEYCGSYHFPAASRDGVRRLGKAQESIACPICRDALHVISLDDRYQGYQCDKCQGLLLDRSAFGDTVQTRRAWASEPPEPARPLNQRDLERSITCPLCNQTMNTHPYYGPGTIVIDDCDQCKLVWLDYGELARVINAPGRDRGAALLKQEKPVEKPDQKKSDKKRRHRKGIDLLELLDDLFS